MFTMPVRKKNAMASTEISLAQDHVGAARTPWGTHHVRSNEHLSGEKGFDLLCLCIKRRLTFYLPCVTDDAVRVGEMHSISPHLSEKTLARDKPF